MRIKSLSALVVIIFVIFVSSETRGIQVSGGIDGRCIIAKDNEVELEGLFLNTRQVFSDRKGDRFIVVAQVDIDHNLEEVRPHQTYFQYKGPLGMWNIRLGIYNLPFGMLPDYDTERLVLQAIDPLSRGIKLDAGIQLLGYFGNIDYAVSLSQGVGRSRLTDVDDNKLVSARLSWQGENSTVGISGFIGNVLIDEGRAYMGDIGSDNIYEKRMGLDMARYAGSLIVRGELLIGTDNNEIVGGGVFLSDYAMSSTLELNLKYAHWQRSGSRNFIGGGISCRLYQGVILRIGDEYHFGKERENVLTFQAYYDFIRYL